MSTTNRTARSGADAIVLGARIAAAVLGGYLLATAAVVLMVRTVSMPRPDALLAGMLSSFAVFALTVLAAFAARSVLRVWLVIAAVGGGCAALAWLLGPAGVP